MIIKCCPVEGNIIQGFRFPHWGAVKDAGLLGSDIVSTG
jgi:hypothetical protein